MKIYLASSFELTPLVEMVSKELESLGHRITVKWWSKDGFDLRDKKNDTEHPGNFYSHPIIEKIFLRDYRGVIEADVFILVADNTPRKFNGANIELGIAIAKEKPVFSIGKLENSALYYPVTKCYTFDQLLEKLHLWEYINATM